MFFGAADHEEPTFTVILDNDDDSVSDMLPLAPKELPPSIPQNIILEFNTGDKLIYFKDRHEDTVIVKSQSLNSDSEILQYEIKFDKERILSTTR